MLLFTVTLQAALGATLGGVMAFHTVAVTDVRRGLRDILAQLTGPLFLTQHGRVKAVILDIDTYNSMVDELDDARLAADPEIRRVMHDVRGAYDRGDMIPLEDALRNDV
jgi:PHD/YefM family antitoxin component YafN of YafNO toxin-antitoxin module